MDATKIMSQFETTNEDTIPIPRPSITKEKKNMAECSLWCQQEVECVTFSVTLLATGSVTCLMYNFKPSVNEYQPETGAVTMELTKTNFA